MSKKVLETLSVTSEEAEEIKKIVKNIEVQKLYGSFRVKTTGKIAAFLSYIARTEYKSRCTFAYAEHTLNGRTIAPGDEITEKTEKEYSEMVRHQRTDICRDCTGVLVTMRFDL